MICIRLAVQTPHVLELAICLNSMDQAVVLTLL
jgi:hypothetical protein